MCALHKTFVDSFLFRSCISLLFNERFADHDWMVVMVGKNGKETNCVCVGVGIGVDVDVGVGVGVDVGESSSCILAAFRQNSQEQKVSKIKIEHQ